MLRQTYVAGTHWHPIHDNYIYTVMCMWQRYFIPSPPSLPTRQCLVVKHVQGIAI